MIYSPQENRQFHVFARFARFQTSRLAAGICNRHAAKLSLPMHSKMCPHCHSGGRAWLAAPCRAARDLLLMVLCRAMGLSRVPVRSRPTTRSLAHARATALAHVQQSLTTSRLLAHAPVTGRSCNCPSAIAFGSLQSGATQAAFTADDIANRCALRRARVTAPHACGDLGCARDDHREATGAPRPLWPVNTTTWRARGEMCPFPGDAHHMFFCVFIDHSRCG